MSHLPRQSLPFQPLYRRHAPDKSLEDSNIRLQKKITDPDIVSLAIILKPEAAAAGDEPAPSPKVIGVCGTLSPGAEIAYSIHPAYWGKGYMTEALTAFIGKAGIFWDLPGTLRILFLF